MMIQYSSDDSSPSSSDDSSWSGTSSNELDNWPVDELFLVRKKIEDMLFGVNFFAINVSQLPRSLPRSLPQTPSPLHSRPVIEMP